MEQHTFESGVRFSAAPNTTTEVAATFMTTSEGQLQHLFIGIEPVLVVQPEYDADENKITLVVTGVDLNPPALLEVLRNLTDAVEKMVEVDQEVLAEMDAADAALREASEEFDKAIES